MPEQSETSNSNPHLIPIGIAVSVVVCVAIGGYFYWQIRALTPDPVVEKAFNEEYVHPLGLEVPGRGSAESEIVKIASANVNGDYRNAIALFDEVMSNPDITKAEKVRATMSVVGARFNESGNFEDYIKDLNELKALALDESLDPRLRADVLNTIGSSYCRAGWQPEVFDAIYSGPVFETFRVAGDPNESSRKLYEWSYSLYPKSKAAVRIARWYVETSLPSYGLPEKQRLEHIEIAKKYMLEGAALAKDTQELYDNLENSNAYVAYLYWTAFNSGKLAQMDIEPFASNYKQAYADFFAMAEKSSNVSINQMVPYAHFYFANALHRTDNDVEAAKPELLKVIASVESDPNPKANQFSNFMRNGADPGAFSRLSKISPEFDAFVKRVKGQ